MWHMLGRTHRHLMALAAGGVLFLNSGCDPAVRATILGGVESATNRLLTAFVAAYFQSLSLSDEEQQIARVVVDQLSSLVA